MPDLLLPTAIDQTQWESLCQRSPVSSWFQTPEYYNFLVTVGNIVEPFLYGVSENGQLTGLIVGYIASENGLLKRLFSQRAIIIGGPLLSGEISDEALRILLDACVQKLHNQAIYIETRNLNNYTQWRPIFEECGFLYQPHLNFHVDCHKWNEVEANIGKHRKKYTRLSLRDGAEIIEHPSEKDAFEYYQLLDKLYSSKIHKPLFPWEFFKALYYLPSCHYILIRYNAHIIGGSICMEQKNHAVFEWFSCGKDGDYKNIHPSTLAKYAGMKFASEQEINRYDMMGAGCPQKEYGVRNFKAEFGGELVEYGRYLYQCDKLRYAIGKFGIRLLHIE